jgi:hypothetical protein
VKNKLVNPAKYSRASAWPRAKERCCRSSRTCSTGSPPRRASRSSQATRAAPAGTLAASTIQLQAGQPETRPSTSGMSRSSSTAVSSTLPAMSRSCSSASCRRGSTLIATGTSAAPMNKLTRNTQRQPSDMPMTWISTPPMSGPSAVEMPTTPPR